MTIRKITIIAPFLFSAFVLTAPALAQDRGITCEMVRTYVAQVGLEEARAVAAAHGMTASQEKKARACLLLEDSSQPAGEAKLHRFYAGSPTVPRAAPPTANEEAQAN
jgi:hypothetical protein